MPRFLKPRARAVNLENLRIGIRKRQKGWDDHNRLYLDLEDWRRKGQGITEDFWKFLFNELHLRWGATRHKPKGRDIFKKGSDNLDKLTALYNELSKHGDPNSLSFKTIDSDHFSALFELANSIKGSSPPTFGSNLCHFLFPSAYFIWDNTLVKKVSKWKDDYQIYWEDLKGE
jgi:hypothetical protein